MIFIYLIGFFLTLAMAKWATQRQGMESRGQQVFVELLMAVLWPLSLLAIFVASVQATRRIRRQKRWRQ